MRTSPGFRAATLRSLHRRIVPGKPYVYFLGWPDGPIKIGFARDLQRRWQEIQIACPYPIFIWAVTEGSERDERRYHHQFRAHRLRGEWFERAVEIEEEIARLNGKKSGGHLLLVHSSGNGAAN